MHELLRALEGVTEKRMFGGSGFYKEGVIFAMVAGGKLYFKVDDEIVDAFEKEGSEPFIYIHESRKPVTMPYWLLPESARDNLEWWIGRSVAASKRKKKTSRSG